MKKWLTLPLATLSIFIAGCGAPNSSSLAPASSTTNASNEETSRSSAFASGASSIITGVSKSEGSSSQSSEENSVSTTSIKAEDSSESTVNEVLIESIVITNSTLEIYEDETLQLAYSILPADATNQNLIFESSDETTATVSATGLVTAKKEGEVNILIRAEKGEAKVTIKVTVKKRMNQDLYKEILGKTYENELNFCDKGTFTYVAKDVPVEYAWQVYSSRSIQTAVTAGDVSSIVAVYRDGDAISQLTKTTDSVRKDTLMSGTEYDNDAASEMLQAFSFKGIRTISKIALNSLTDEQFATKENTYSKEADGSLSKYIVANSYTNTGENILYENRLEFTITSDFKLLSFYLTNDQFKINGNEQTKLDSSISIRAALSYEERKETSDDAISESEFKVTDFTVDTSAWRENNTLYVGDKVPLAVNVLAPKIYLPDTFKIDDDGVNPSGIVNITSSNNVTYIEALRKGTCTLTVKSSYEVAREIEVTVIDVPPARITIAEGIDYLSELENGQTGSYKVAVYGKENAQLTTENKAWECKFGSESMAEAASLEKDAANNLFKLTGKEIEEDCDVTVIVYSSVDPAITSSITVKIKKTEKTVDPTPTGVKALMVGKTYSGKKVASLYNVDVTFIDETTGTITISYLYGTKETNVYSFDWEVDEGTLKVSYTNIQLTSGGAKQSSFDGAETYEYKNKISNDAKTLTIVIKNTSGSSKAGSLTQQA